MKITILYPPISKEERYSSSLGSSGGRQIPLGIYYLAAYVRQCGHEVQAIDAEAEDLTAQECLEKIEAFGPDVLGISSTTVAFHRALEVTTLFVQAHPDVFTVIGGPHPSSNPEHTLGYSCFHCAVLREGEETLKELLECLETKKDWHGLDGIAYRDDAGKCIVNKHRAQIADLDSLPFPAYDLIPDISVYTPPPSNYRSFPVANIITSRGCPNQCTFCDQNVFGRRLRQRSPENIAEELLLLRNTYNIQEIAFVDDTFTINYSRIPQIFSILQKAGVSFTWSCMSRVNTLTREAVRQMREYGCWRISFGIESGDPEILKTIKKNISLEQVREVLQWCKEEHIETSGFFMVGHPGETKESMEKTIRFALSLPLSSMVTTINTPIPGSPQYAEADKYGTLDATDWAEFNYWRPVFIPNGLDQKQLLETHHSFYRRFYFRPRIVLVFLKSFFSKGGLKRLFYLIKSMPYLLFGK